MNAKMEKKGWGRFGKREKERGIMCKDRKATEQYPAVSHRVHILKF